MTERANPIAHFDGGRGCRSASWTERRRASSSPAALDRRGLNAGGAPAFVARGGQSWRRPRPDSTACCVSRGANRGALRAGGSLRRRTRRSRTSHAGTVPLAAGPGGMSGPRDVRLGRSVSEDAPYAAGSSTGRSTRQPHRGVGRGVAALCRGSTTSVGQGLAYRCAGRSRGGAFGEAGTVADNIRRGRQRWSAVGPGKRGGSEVDSSRSTSATSTSRLVPAAGPLRDADARWDGPIPDLGASRPRR